MKLTTLKKTGSKFQLGTQMGTTLIEVLVSLLVLSGGMLTMAGMQSVSLQNNQSSYYRTQATTLTIDMVERMRANLAGVDDGGYNNVAGVADADCFTTDGCTDVEMAAQDILTWETQVAAALPGGDSVVCLDSTPSDGTTGAMACDNTGSIYAIKIWWDDDRDGTANRRYVTTFQPL